MNSNEIITFLKDNPGSIAAEIGATAVEMSRLFKEGLVEKVGARSTGKRGRPPVEWAVAGAAEAEASRAIALPEVDVVLDDEDQRKIDYIDSQVRSQRFAGDLDEDKRADLNSLLKTRKDILRRARNAATRVVEQPVPTEDED